MASTVALRGSTVQSIAAQVRALPVVLPPVVAAQAAPILTALARADFDSGRTPDGATRPQGVAGAVSLKRTGALRAGLIFKPRGSRLVVELPPHAVYLTRFRVLPAGLPARWVGALAVVAQGARA